jgi:dolichol kinase
MGTRLTKLRGKLHSERLKKLQARMHAKKEEYKLELKRQAVHAIGLLVVVFLLLFEESLAVKILAILTGLALVGNWYLSRRKFRSKYIHKLLHELGLPHHDAASWEKASSDTQGFEETVIWGVLRNFVRQRDREPLIATFWSLFSALLAAAIFGIQFAILGLFVLSIGDSVSTIIGKKWGRAKIFWNKEKSWVGFISFVVFTLIAGIIFLKYFPQFAIFNPPTLVVLMALSGALIETIPAVDDNSTIPFGVAAAVWLALTYF